MATPVDVLKAGLADVRESETLSDCKKFCGAYHFKVHKVILSTQSECFKTALKSGTFKGESGVIELKATSDDFVEEDDVCDDPEIVKLMIEYFYHLDYLRKPETSTSPSDTAAKVFLIEHAKVFAMAVKYWIVGLRHPAVKKLKEAVEADWSHEDFAHTLHVVYNSTTEDITELRDIVATTIHDNFKILKDRDEVEVVASSIPGLAYALLKRSREEYSSETCTQGHKSSTILIRYDNYSHEFVYCTLCCVQNKTVTCPKCIRNYDGYGGRCTTNFYFGLRLFESANECPVHTANS